MAPAAEGEQATRHIVAHPFFSTIVVLWFAALFSLSTLAIRGALLEEAVLASHIDLILPAATPPLGMTARLLIAALLGTVGAGLGWVVAKYIGASVKPAQVWAEDAQSHSAVPSPVEASPWLQPVPPVRRPISAHEELGAERLDAPLQAFRGHAAVAPAYAQPAYAQPAYAQPAYAATAHATHAYADYSATSAYPGYHAPAIEVHTAAAAPVPEAFPQYSPQAFAPQTFAPQTFTPAPYAPEPYAPEPYAATHQTQTGWMPQGGFETARLAEPAPFGVHGHAQNSWDPRGVAAPAAPVMAVDASAPAPIAAPEPVAVPQNVVTAEAVAPDFVTADVVTPEAVALETSPQDATPQETSVIEAPAAPASARKRIATTALPQLGSVELIERLAIALERRNARIAGQAAEAAPTPAQQAPAWNPPHAVAATDAPEADPLPPATPAPHADTGKALDLALKGLRDIG